MKRIFAASLVAFGLFAIVFASFTLFSATPVEAKCGICPHICIGVTCDDGKTYCNSCLAACAGAHNCVVTGF